MTFRGSSAENNTFYHNNFIGKYDNLVYAYITNSAGALNFWDSGQEGNFWDNYNGSDADRDGIGDVPYVIDADNVDHYPLMEPYDVENDTIVLPPPDLLPTVLAATALVAAAVGVYLIVHFKKRTH